MDRVHGLDRQDAHSEQGPLDPQQARDLLAGNGLLLDFHVARHLTDMEVVHTYEGTEFIQSLLIGRKITGQNAL